MRTTHIRPSSPPTTGYENLTFLDRTFLGTQVDDAFSCREEIGNTTKYVAVKSLGRLLRG